MATMQCSRSRAIAIHQIRWNRLIATTVTFPFVEATCESTQVLAALSSWMSYSRCNRIPRHRSASADLRQSLAPSVAAVSSVCNPDFSRNSPHVPPLAPPLGIMHTTAVSTGTFRIIRRGRRTDYRCGETLEPHRNTHLQTLNLCYCLHKHVNWSRWLSPSCVDVNAEIGRLVSTYIPVLTAIVTPPVKDERPYNSSIYTKC